MYIARNGVTYYYGTLCLKLLFSAPCWCPITLQVAHAKWFMVPSLVQAAQAWSHWFDGCCIVHHASTQV